MTDTPIPPEIQAAITELFEAQAPRLFDYACATLTQGDRDKADDLVQQTFHDATKGWSNDLAYLDAEGRSRWLFRVVKNKAIDAWRKERRVTCTEIFELEDPQPDVCEQMLYSAALEECWKVIAKMPPDRARVAALHWGEQRPTKEIAEQLGITQSTVRGHLRKARNELISRVGEQVPFIEHLESEYGKRGEES